MTYPEDLRYTKEHEWVRAAGDVATFGITFHAQKELGDIVYVDLPKVGDTAQQGKMIGSVESVKAVSDIYSPVSGEVLGSRRFVQPGILTFAHQLHGNFLMSRETGRPFVGWLLDLGFKHAISGNIEIFLKRS